MHLLRRIEDVLVGPPTVCCIGSFDGVHVGHQRLIGDAVAEAHQRGMRSAVVTFFPHPRAVIGRTLERYLTLPEEKAALIAVLGVDVMLLHEFTLETVNTRAESFTRSLCEAFKMRSMWAGPDFAFGYRREGTTTWLTAASTVFGFDMHVAEPVLQDGRVVSSTWVREALMHGDISAVKRMLGRPYTVEGRVAADGRRVQLDVRRIWPSPGRYAVEVGGQAAVLRLDAIDAPGEFDRVLHASANQRIIINFA